MLGEFAHRAVDIAQIRPEGARELGSADADEVDVTELPGLGEARGEPQPPAVEGLREQFGQTGSKKGTSPEFSRSILSGSTSTPRTSKPRTAMQMAWVAPR